MDYIEEDWTITVIIVSVCLMATAYVVVLLRCCLECVKVLTVRRCGGDDEQTALDESEITVVSEEELPTNSIVLPIEKDSGIPTPRWI